ncbi:zinc transport system substrate-binding protein [Thermodesulfovibrio aggregans]|uniref:Zinc transport system substrate-binding protein n=1 Tax=Thermodesulfovibrio aggregans TaxID=86166 RepID=A0A0U9HWA4_9BACT|nr:zinc ABC transporter substrate-binding protein [Thermodesulfovibrio aggregans]GAQ94719.1 zinc transport system substrate-binding protein [Thermodesulfovibrio aggregans]
MKRKFNVQDSRFNFIISLFLIFSVTVFLLSCSGKPEKTSKSILVYTSLYPLEEFTKWIIPEAQVESLMPQGVDPHNFEPSLKDIQKLSNADMIVYLGDTDIDRWLDKIRNEFTQKGVKLVRLQDSIQFRKYSSSNEIDPHIWLDPVLVTEMIKAIKNAVEQIAPERKELYEKNFSIYEAKLKELDNLYKKELSNCALKDVIITHEFLNYLQARYGFYSYFIVHEPEQEPSLKKIKQLKEVMKKNSIDYIISEPEGDKIAKALSEETGAKILKFNTLHTSLPQNKIDYFHTMHENLKTLKTALKCQ